MNDDFRKIYGAHLQPELIKEILDTSTYKVLPPKSELMDYGDYIKGVPFLLSGAIKTLRKNEAGQEIFLYFITPGETCAMTLSCCIGHTKSEIKAITETETRLLIAPVQKIEQWGSQYKSWRVFVFKTYHDQLMRSLETIDNIAFKKLDQRLVFYLKAQQEITGKNSLKITHKEIASDLNSSRVVISRLLKKLEHQNAIEINHNCIRLLAL